MTFRSLLPDNAIKQEVAVENATYEIINKVPNDASVFKNPDLCPEHYLPWLAWEYAVSGWEPDWPVDIKRQVIKEAAYVHQHSGTPAAVERALSSIGYPTEIREWFQETPLEEPYTFKVKAFVDGNVTEETYDKIRKQVNKAKNLRSYLSLIEIISVVEVTAPVYSAAAHASVIHVKIKPQD